MSDHDQAADQFKAAAVVFEGEVLPGARDLATWNGQVSLRAIPFRVLRLYKGDLGDFIEVYDAAAALDCGFGEPKPGTQLFVYGFRDQPGRIYYHACSRTMALDQAGSDIRFASGEPPTKEDLAPAGEKWRLLRDPTLATRGARITGRVRRADSGDVSGVFVTLWAGGENERRIGVIGATQKVNQDGSFEIRFLPPGHYIITAIDRLSNPILRLIGEFGSVKLAERQVLPDVTIALHAEPLAREKSDLPY